MQSEHSIQNVKRIKPGVVLFVFILFVSALLIYKIQSTESIHPHRDSLSGQSENPADQLEKSVGATETPTPILDPVTPEPELVLTQTANRQSLLPDVKTVKEGELESTSWQNPFYRLFWKSKGWQFTEAGMVSSADQLSAATFLRPYKKISVSFRVDVEQKFPSFDLKLLTRDPAKPDQVLVSSAIHFQNDGVSVSAIVQAATKELKHIKLDLTRTKPESVRIRFVGTGNRFVLSIGGRRILTCAQPAQQSGKECFLSFLASGERVQISALRIEGE